MDSRDANQIAAWTLRRAVQRAARVHADRSRDYFAGWRKARSDARNAPQARKRIAPRLPLPPITPDELARIGRVDGLAD